MGNFENVVQTVREMLELEEGTRPIPASASGTQTVSLIHHPSGVYSHPSFGKHHMMRFDHGLDDEGHNAFADVKPATRTIEINHYSHTRPPGEAMRDMEDHLTKRYKLPARAKFVHRSAYRNW